MRKTFLIIITLVFFCTRMFSQTPEELLEKTRLNFTPEKIYIHFDKENYVAGDTIWFKAYLMDGFLPATHSTILNVEVINDSGIVVGKKILPITASMAAGAIELPNNLYEGSYNVVAFTRLLMNFGTNCFYSKQLNIFNPLRKALKTDVTYNPELNFLPEGGYLVADLFNNLIFKCIDNNGFPQNVEGVIKDNSGNEIVKFISTHDGMGKINFKPKAGEKYIAECIINGTTKKSLNLPLPVLNRSLLSVYYKDDKSFLEINNTNVSTEEMLPAYILGVEENTIAFKIPISNNKKIINAEIPVSTLPSGILKITSFNKNNLPLSERLLFINSGDYQVKTNFRVDKLNTAARKFNKFSFVVDDTTLGSYSVAVTNADNLIENADGVDNLISRFLLTANLKGKINNPSYYFDLNDVEHKEKLDLVMLTNGWARYSWSEILTNKFPPMIYDDLNYISLKGTAYKPFTRYPLSESALLIYAQTNDSLPSILNNSTNKFGNFEIPGIIFEDTATFYFQNTKGRDKRINLQMSTLSLTNAFSVTKANIPFFKFKIPTDEQNSMITNLFDENNRKYSHIKLMDEIRLQTKAKSVMEKYEEKYVSGVLGNFANRTLDLLKNPPIPGMNIFDFLKTRLLGVSISGGPLDYQVNYRGLSSMTGGKIPMTIYLDEFQVEASQIATMQADDIALVKVYNSGPLVGPGGALALYTNKDRNHKSSGYSSLSSSVIEGFSITKEFYSPNYENSSVSNDNRTTLYWNPYLVPDKRSTELSFSFYNSDNAKKFKIVLEGVTRDGGLVHFEKIVE